MLTPKKQKKKFWNASWAACGDGCLDKLVVSVKKASAASVAVKGGRAMRYGPIKIAIKGRTP